MVSPDLMDQRLHRVEDYFCWVGPIIGGLIANGWILLGLVFVWVDFLFLLFSEVYIWNRWGHGSTGPRRLRSSMQIICVTLTRLAGHP